MNSSIISGKPVFMRDEEWMSLSEINRDLYLRIRPHPKVVYEVDCHLNQIEHFIKEVGEDMRKAGGEFDLNPDYQRGHVWNMSQRVAYMEAVIRDIAPTRVLFNCPAWTGRSSAEVGGKFDIKPHTFQCIDGLQRLTTVRQFMAGEFEVFGDLSAEKLKGTMFYPGRLRMQFRIYEFMRRCDLLAFYLDLNAAGTAHSQGELDRVRQLLKETQS